MKVRIKKKVVEMFPKKEEGMVVMKRKNWKKISTYVAAGAVIVGTGIVIAIKAKNNDGGIGYPMDLSVFGDGIGYDAKILWNNDKIVHFSVEDMSVRNINEMLNIMNPDVYGISMDTKWDEIIFVQH